MSRTYRNRLVSDFYLRAMRTTNEISQNAQLFSDIRANDIPYTISNLNRFNRYIPNCYDDIRIAAISEIYTEV